MCQRIFIPYEPVPRSKLDSHYHLTKRAPKKATRRKPYRINCISSVIMAVIANMFIDKRADFPWDTRGDARKDQLEEWEALASTVDYKERIIFAIFRTREAVMIGYCYNKTGILACLRKGLRGVVSCFSC